MGEKDGEGGRLDRLQWYLEITCELCFPGPPGLWVPGIRSEEIHRSSSSVFEGETEHFGDRHGQ